MTELEAKRLGANVPMAEGATPSCGVGRQTNPSLSNPTLRQCSSLSPQVANRMDERNKKMSHVGLNYMDFDDDQV